MREVSNSTSILPKNWVVKSIGDVAKVLPGYGFPEEYQGKNQGELPFFKVRDISQTFLKGSMYLNKSNNYISLSECVKLKAKPLNEGTIVFAKIGEALKLNRRAILTQPSLIDNNTVGIYGIPEVLNRLYLYYFFLTVKLDNLSRATTVPSVRKSDIEEIKIPIAPYKEQLRIVAKVETLFSFLDAGTDTLRKVQLQLKCYRQAVLKYAFEGKLTGKNRKFRFDRELNLEVPVDWNMKMARELFYIKGRIGWRGLKKAHFVPEGPYLITGVDFHNGFVDWNKCYRIPMDKYLESPEIIVQKDDILVTKDGTIGKVACLGEIPNGKASINAHILLIRNREKSVIMPKFIYYMLHSQNFLNFVERRKIGTTRPALTQRAFEAFPFYYPHYGEQEEIVVNIERFLSIADDLSKTLNQNLVRSKILKQTILKSAFEGILISQDIADESAEKLLDRIK